MKKTIIATSLLTLFAAPSFAAEIYKDENTSASLGGYLGIRIIDNDNTTDMTNGSSRFNFKFTRQLDANTQVAAAVEWGFNPFGDTKITSSNNGKFAFEAADEMFQTRLANVTIANKHYGSLTIGKQWGAFYDVTANTDQGFKSGASASGTYGFGDGGLNGTGRADNAVQYRKDYGMISFAAQMQLQENEYAIEDMATGIDTITYNNTYGLAVTVKPMNNITLVAGGNIGTVDVVGTESSYERDDSIYGFAATYGKIGQQGIYAAFNYTVAEYHELSATGLGLIPEADGLEVFAAYQINNHLRPYIMYNYRTVGGYEDSTLLKGTDESVDEIDYIALGSLYQFNASFLTYAEMKVDNSEADNNEVTLGLRFTF